MKKRIVFLAALALFTVTVLSSWEGAAAAAPEGELPASGFYVATNSFPKNIVVDVTNLETNKTTRAIVANGLDNPGLLAIVSREAAELIGMRPGSVSKIRMVQPADPVAYLNFRENAASGTPYYSSGDVIREDLYREDTYKPPAEAKEVPVNSMTGPGYVLEPEWRTRAAAPYSPGTPADYSVAPVEKTVETPAITEPVQDKKTEEPPAVTEPVPEKKTEEPPAIVEPVQEKKIEEPPVVTEPVPEKKPEEPPVYIAEVPPPKKEFIMTPAEERPPDNTVYGIDPAYIIPGITRMPPEKEPDNTVYEIDPAYVIPGITRMPPEKEPDNTVYGIDPAYIIPGIKTALPAEETPPEKPVIQPVIPPVNDSAFSVPSITKLDRGKYYVQIASCDRPEDVENVLKKIDRRYNPVVFTANDAAYRILLGPLNQGESAAVLQRFKSIGYKDAFVRHEK